MNAKVIPKKNYVIFTVLIIVTISLCIYLSIWYKTIKSYNENNSVLTSNSVIAEIDINSFSSYVLDNPDMIVFVSSTKDLDIKSFEKQFSKIINEYDLGREILYFDISNPANENGLSIIKDNYLDKELSNIKEIVSPNLIRIEYGKITDILNLKKKKITKDDVINFLERNGYLEND